MTSFFKKKTLSALSSLGIMSKTTRKNFERYLEKYRSNGRVLDVGSGTGAYFAFFPNRTTVDIAPHEGVDVVADAHELSKHFTEGEFDVVLCIEALEHFYHPHKAVEEMSRVLKRGGTLILSTRFMFPLHEVPHDYFRFTEYGLKHLLRDFDILEFHRDGNTIETLAILYERIGYQCDTLWFKPLKLFWFLEARFLFLFTRVLTAEYGDINQQNRVPNIMTSGYFVVAQKK